MQKWKHIGEQLKTLLSEHKFTFEEAVKAIDCGEKTLRRYMDAQYVAPIKTSDEWHFTMKQIEKCRFMHDLKTRLNMQVPLAAGLYDYLDSIGHTPDTEELIKYMTFYKYGETNDDTTI